MPSPEEWEVAPDLSHMTWNPDAAPKAQCGRCGRWTWAPIEFGQEDRMRQPDGFPCGGMFTKAQTGGPR